MSYSQHDFYSDDPIDGSASPVKKKFPGFVAFLLLIFAGGSFLQTTLAANISLNNGQSVEFGQGFTQAVACSGGTNLTITPNSTFTNTSGSGAYYLSSVTVSNIPTSCYGRDFTLNAYDNASNTPLAIFNTTSTNAVIYNNAGTFQAGIGSAGMSVTSGSGSFTATFSTPVALTNSIFKLTIQSGSHSTSNCAQGGICVVGDTGPGGGTVFYVSASAFTVTGANCNTNCRYLEFAPNGWSNGGVPAFDARGLGWSSNASTLTGQNVSTAASESSRANEKYNWGIGQGFYNTSVMKVAGATSTIQSTVLAYAGNVTAGEWFLPSLNELNELCKYANGATTGDPKVSCVGTSSVSTTNLGFADYRYKSSSEINASTVMFINFANSAAGGGHKNGGDGSSDYIRPIRAF